MLLTRLERENKNMDKEKVQKADTVDSENSQGKEEKE